MMEVKPCPFCGATESEDNATQEAGVVCTSFKSPVGLAWRVECNCGSSGAADMDFFEAIRKWNLRTQNNR